MKKIKIKEISGHESFEVMGFTFRNIQEVEDAVSIISRYHISWNGKRDIWTVEPKKAISGIYIGMIYEPYPCFDSYDYACENRSYWNFFFSDKPFTIQYMNRLSELPIKGNYKYIHEDMPEWATPALYWGGDRTDNILLATVY